ncbi:MAG: CPBP family intramembrane metalloprotease, partial [Caldilineaceae bacterium]|nr:CPBP family intramembrane metalloprotease [Caldilineaceae bacterium]
PNALPTIQARVDRNCVGWTGPLVMTFLMTVLAALTSLGLTAYFAARGRTNPGDVTMTWINVWNTLLYLPLLLALIYFVHREGLRLRDLVGFERSRLWRDIGIGLALFLGLLIGNSLLEFGVSRLIFAFFGNPYAGLDFTMMPRPMLLPLFFGLIGLPLGAGIVEELVYRGYVLPRLVVLSNRWTGLLIMAAGFGVQHVGLALAGDWRLALERGIALAITGLVLGMIYLRQERLLPLIIAHVTWNFVGIGLLSGLLPFLMN